MYRERLQGWLKHIDFILIDAVLMELAFYLAYYLRHRVFGMYSLDLYRESAVIILVAEILVSVFGEVHKNILRRNSWQELRNVIKLVTLTSMALVLYIFMFRHDALFSRSVYIFFYVLSVVFVYAGNLLWKLFLLKRPVSYYQLNHMLVVAHSDNAETVIKKLRENSFNEYAIIGIVLMDNKLRPGTSIADIPVVCRYEDTFDYIQGKWIDEIMIWLPNQIGTDDAFLDRCVEMGITTHISVSIETDRECQHTIEKYGGTRVITESIRIASPRQLFIKRVMDIVGAIVGLAFTAVFTVIFGPMIYISDPGPIFFSQERVGKNGRIFRIHKFRSMYTNAEERKADLMDQNKMSGYMFKMDADPRILGSGPDGTRHGIGWFIRKTSIDEFPQFWNVLVGEMSLVGTRPPTVDEWTQYESHHRARMAVRPGITGLWQVSGRSDIEDFEEVIKLDMEYINSWDIGMDIRLILKTIGIIFTGKGAE